MGTSVASATPTVLRLLLLPDKKSHYLPMSLQQAGEYTLSLQSNYNQINNNLGRRLEHVCTLHRLAVNHCLLHASLVDTDSLLTTVYYMLVVYTDSLLTTVYYKLVVDTDSLLTTVYYKLVVDTDSRLTNQQSAQTHC